MEQSLKNGSLFNSESEEKDSFSSEIQEKVKEEKENIEINPKQEIDNNYNFNNQIELKYITEINRNTLYLNLEKILLNRESLTNLVKNIFHRILKTNSVYQSYNDIHKVLLQTKTKFYDDLFPPNINSLIKGYHPNKYSKKNYRKTLGEIIFKEYKDIVWKRESESINNNIYILPQDNIFINKIIYNKLSNPNLYSAINALGNFPERIKKLFINSKKDSTCLYAVNICRNGNLQQVVVDDFFPFNQKNNNKSFITDEKGLLWPQILEKSYAKIYGSYNLISEKSMENILKDLTCAPVITLDSFGDNLSKELLEAYEKKWIIMAGAGDTDASEELLKDLGLPPNSDHEISLVYKLTEENINQITSNSLNIPTNDDYNTVLKIRNLLGKIEWIGDWSDYSGLWNDNFKSILNYNPGEKSFYMNLKDFKLYFSRIKICKYIENYKYQSINVSQKPEEYAIIRIKTTKIDDGFFDENNISYISFIQEEKKVGKERKNIYGLGRLILCKLHNNEIQYIKGKMGQEREIVLEHQMKFKGEEYLLFCQLDKIPKKTQFVISIYSPHYTELEIIPFEDFPNILEKIYISCAKLSGKADHLENGSIECYKFSYTTPEGYSYIYIENHENDATYIEDIKYTKFDGLKLLPPFKGTSYHIEVGPHSNQIILIKHLDLSEYSLIFSYQSNVLYGKKTLIKYTKEKGKQKKRTDKKTKSEIDIIVYTYKYSFGLCYYYENKTNDKRLKEKINITNNSNIEFLGQPEGTNEINVILDPGQTYFVELRGKSVLWKVQPYISYNIENLNHSSF